MEHVIREGIVLKDISEEELLKQSGVQDQMELLQMFVDCTENMSFTPEVQELIKTAQSMLSGQQSVKRIWGLYENGEYFGHIVLSHYDTATPEVHIEMDEAHQHRGIGYRSLQAVIAEVFEKEAFEHLVYRCKEDNAASIALITKCGGAFLSCAGNVREYHLCRI